METIIVVGDSAIDWLAWEMKPGEYSSFKGQPPLNWKEYAGLQMRAFPGGAMLLSHMLELALADTPDHRVSSYHLPSIENIPPSEVIHSFTLCSGYPVETGRKERVFRVKRHCGYSGPDTGIQPPLTLDHDDPDAPYVLLDDAGNGFRNRRDAWPSAIVTKGKNPLIILKMSSPLVQGPLWEHLLQNHRERLIVVVNARDLRSCGADISYRLSWEHTAESFYQQIRTNSRIRPLTMCKALVVRLNVEGAILCQNVEGTETARLFYDPLAGEDGFSFRYPGSMQGIFCAFVAGFTRHFLCNNNLEEAIRSGLDCSRNLIRKGFGSLPGKPGYDFPLVFSTSRETRSEIADLEVPLPEKRSGEGRTQWTILESVTRSQLEEIAENIVISGTDPSLSPVPVGMFGALRTVDRKEIEGYQSIRNILQEYIGSSHAKPISIAVFGPPGSGKSFGVTQLALSIAPDKITPLEFNLSQFDGIDDLTTAFNAIQDKVLEGKIPLVFFDEFDSSFQGPLGWLKYFLAPMQDGTFRDGEVMHPIGKSIFVFAGGTCDTFDEFRDGKTPGSKELFRSSKGTDFISRLRGCIDIIGCTREEDQDPTCIIRRALLVRSLIERNFRNLLEPDGTARIDRALIRALLHVSSFRHGVRSMQAILFMSMISSKKRFDIPDLPSRGQLRLHVDVPEFTNLLLHYSLLESAIETLAQKFHEHYLARELSAGTTSRSTVPWNELPVDLQESNQEEARHITEKLRAVNCWFTLKDPASVNLPTFNQDDLLTLAKMEHDRWLREKRKKGWSYGTPRNDAKRIHPDMVSWEKLSEESRKKDFDAVEKIPQMLADIGFEIYKDRKPESIS